MEETSTTTSSPTTDPAAPAASSSTASAPTESAQAAAPTGRRELASFDDALRSASVRQRTGPARASKSEGDPPPPAPAGSDDTTGGSAVEASKPGPSASSADQPAERAEPQPDGGSAPTSASKPDQPESGPEAEKPSRRESAAIRDLTNERDALRNQVAAMTPPEHVTQAMQAVRLTDDEFSRLEDKLKRENLTGEYLTVEERDQYDRALQVRQWLAPAYEDAQKQAVEAFNLSVQGLKQEQADALAPVLRARPHISGARIAASTSWQAVYEHIADASFEAGATAKAAEIQPKLDEATGRIADLENELSGFRHGRGAGRGLPLERGGQSGGAFGARPDYREASASDLFNAALADEARRRSRRGGQPAARSA